jgi:hypothetical protein
MPTFIKMVVESEQPSEFAGHDVRAVALFCSIGLVAALIAVSTGVQGVWL